VPRDDLPDVLRWISDVLPLSYAVDAMKEITVNPDPLPEAAGDLAIVFGFIVLALALASLTLSRRTP
jgi:ABC-2 type transport system permease protein